ncbi:MAG: glycosyltransferase, partial [Candidatus Electrothrix sp. ATG1]|nr:glycosyltransferase [Candidatus Electrothrix sp. ATG1]
CITPNAVFPGEVDVDIGRQYLLRQKYGINVNDTVFGFVGSIFPHHGVDLLLQAFDQVYAQMPEAHLLIVGDGEIRSELERSAHNFHCVDRITFTGNVPHESVYDHIGLMDITLMVRSNWYGSPVKIFEYGVLGKPIIAPNNSPVRDVMVQEQHGLLVNPDVEDIAAAMERLAKDAELRSRIGQTFREKIFREHTWEQMAEKVLRAINT